MCTLDGCGSATGLPPIELGAEARRNFLLGLGALPLATVLFYPDLAAAQAATTQAVDVTVNGGTDFSGAISLPESEEPAPAVILIHEWWGLNDQIKAMAAEFAKQGYVAFAIDLYGGEVADTPDGAKALMSSLDNAVAGEQMKSAVNWLRGHERCNGKIATVGWCFGGGWSINTATLANVDATIVYYGRLPQSAEELANVNAPVLGHFGTEDQSINAAMVGGFERAMDEAGKTDLLEVHWYTANHAFANPTGARYDEDDAALSWARTLAFLANHLG